MFFMFVPGISLREVCHDDESKHPVSQTKQENKKYVTLSLLRQKTHLTY
jgi:hypothetical protein